jgi:hypothetical protein
VVTLLWCVAAAYTIGYCALFGYGRSAKDLHFVFGIPDWVVWGIVVPWSVCVGIGCWFSWFFMTDDDLGEEQESDFAGSKEVSGYG